MQTCNRNTFTVRAIRGREEVGRAGEGGGGEVFVVEIGQKKRGERQHVCNLELMYSINRKQLYATLYR